MDNVDWGNIVWGNKNKLTKTKNKNYLKIKIEIHKFYILTVKFP